MKTFVDFMHELVAIITIFVDKHFKKTLNHKSSQIKNCR